MAQPLGILEGDELQRAVTATALCAGLVHLFDLDAFVRTAELFSPPQAAVAGHSPQAIVRAQGWAEVGRALLAVRAAASGRSAPDAEVKAALADMLDRYVATGELLLSPPVEDEEGELVAEGAGCPYCGERNMDRLLIQDDGIVDCATCQRRYKLP
jgi:hypothetical protein